LFFRSGVYGLEEKKEDFLKRQWERASYKDQKKNSRGVTFSTKKSLEKNRARGGSSLIEGDLQTIEGGLRGKGERKIKVGVILFYVKCGAKEVFQKEQ